MVVGKFESRLVVVTANNWTLLSIISQNYSQDNIRAYRSAYELFKKKTLLWWSSNITFYYLDAKCWNFDSFTQDKGLWIFIYPIQRLWYNGLHIYMRNDVFLYDSEII